MTTQKRPLVFFETLLKFTRHATPAGASAPSRRSERAYGRRSAGAHTRAQARVGAGAQVCASAGASGRVCARRRERACAGGRARARTRVRLCARVCVCLHMRERARAHLPACLRMCACERAHDARACTFSPPPLGGGESQISTSPNPPPLGGDWVVGRSRKGECQRVKLIRGKGVGVVWTEPEPSAKPAADRPTSLRSSSSPSEMMEPRTASVVLAQ